MKKLELKDKSVEEMTKMLAEKREELRQLRFSGMGRVKDASASKKARADVARIMTELGARKNA
jgi:ribosomal protein L29